MTAEQALAAAKIIREIAAEREGWGYYPLAEALEEHAEEQITRQGMVTILQGYSYPDLPLADVIVHEARQGRTVNIAVQHAEGWAVTGDLLDNERKMVYNGGVGVAPDPGAAKTQRIEKHLSAAALFSSKGQPSPVVALRGRR